MITSIDSNSQITVVGYSSTNEGRGRIIVFGSQTLDILQQIDGTDLKRGVGNYVHIQDDPESLGYRIWYSTNEKLIAASYVTYGQETVFEDEIYDQDVPSTIAT